MNSREFLHSDTSGALRVVIDNAGADAVPLLVCNGFGLSLEGLDSALEAFAGRSIIRFDLPGIGGSSARFGYRFSHIAKQLVDVLDSLAIEQADIYGISWGGMLAQEMALNFPDRCRKLVLAATSSGMVSLPGVPLWKLLRNLPQRRQSSWPAELAAAVYGGEIGSEDWALISRELRAIRAHLPGVIGQVTAVSGWTSVHRLQYLSQPTLLLFGEEDDLVPLSNGRFMHHLMPNARLVTLDCGHMFPWTRTERVYREITQFRQA